jgi:flagellar motor switch protein FliN
MSDTQEEGPLSQADRDAAMAAGLASDSEVNWASGETAVAATDVAVPGGRTDVAGNPFDAAVAGAAWTNEEKAAGRAASPPAAGAAPVKPFTLPSLDTESSGPVPPENIDLLRDVDLHVKIELGRTQMLVEDVLRLASGSVVELDKLAGDPVDVLVNERLVARGEVLVLNDTFCVRISEILSPLEEQE